MKFQQNVVVPSIVSESNFCT